MSSTMTSHLDHGRQRIGPNGNISRQAGNGQAKYFIAPEGIQIIDLCDDSDAEDTIVIQQRARTPLSRTSQNDLSNLRAISNIDQSRTQKRPAATLGPTIRQNSPKKARLDTRHHRTTAPVLACVSPPRSPPPVSGTPNTKFVHQIIKDVPRSKPQSCSKLEKRIGPFVIDSDSEDDEPLQKSALPKTQAQAPAKPTLQAKPFSEMAQVEKHKWWQQLQALAKTNPELARRLIMERKARLQNNAGSPASSTAVIDSKTVAANVAKAGLSSCYTSVAGSPVGSPGLASRASGTSANPILDWNPTARTSAPETSRTKVANGVQYQTAIRTPLSATNTGSHDSKPMGQTKSCSNSVKVHTASGLHERAIPTPGCEDAVNTDSPKTKTSAFQDFLDAASTTSRPSKSGSDLYQDDQKEATSTINAQKAAQVLGPIASASNQESLDAAALRKAKRDKANQDMQRLIREKTQGQGHDRAMGRAPRDPRLRECRITEEVGAGKHPEVSVDGKSFPKQAMPDAKTAVVEKMTEPATTSQGSLIANKSEDRALERKQEAAYTGNVEVHQKVERQEGHGHTEQQIPGVTSHKEVAPQGENGLNIVSDYKEQFSPVWPHNVGGFLPPQEPRQDVTSALPSRDPRLRHHHAMEERHTSLATTNRNGNTEQFTSTSTAQERLASRQDTTSALPSRDPRLRHYHETEERNSLSVQTNTNGNTLQSASTSPAQKQTEPRQDETSIVPLRDPELRHDHGIEERNSSPAQTNTNASTTQSPSTSIGHEHFVTPLARQLLGSFSENSINGQVRLGQYTAPAKPSPFQTRPKVIQPQAKTPGEVRSRQPSKSASKNDLDEFTVGDVKLYKRKEGPMKWNDLIAWYNQDTGIAATEKQLRKRWQNMCKAVDECGLDEDLISQAALGDDGALNELNRLIRERNAARRAQTADPSPAVSVRKWEREAEQSKPQSAPDMGMLSLASTTWPVQPYASRPVCGGKSMGLEAQMAYLEALQQEAIEMNDDTDETEDDSNLTEEDYEQFIYTLVRREWTASDPEEEYETIEDKPWLECSKSFSNLSEANQAVSADVLRARPDKAHIADPDLEFTMQHRKDPADGTLHITLTSSVGAVESRVVRRLRDPLIRTLPHTTSHLAPRRTYFVLQRTTTFEHTDPNCLDAPNKTEITNLLDCTVHTTLRGANHHAITQWLSATFQPTSRNLNMREVEVEQRREALLIEFDVENDEDGARPFRKSVTDDEDVEYELWVEEGRLSGPRNL